MGRSGKGNVLNYKTFCHFCFTEFDIIIEKCNQCGNPTISAEKRMAELKQKVEIYKQDKNRKAERKHKWEMWQKTKASLWKKTSTNYSKWEYFTSSEDENEEERDPILPKNDPNFQALERDLEQRASRKKQDLAKAEELKQKGNDFLKANDYKKAVDKYSEAIELVKDYKILYTNRALAYIKLGKFNRAIDDCSKMLEYCEVFEKGYEKSRDVCLKALMRRALCWKEKSEFENAFQDIAEAEKLSPNDKELQNLRKTLDLAKNHKEMAKEALNKDKNPKNIEKIEKFLASNQSSLEEINEVGKILLKNKNMRVFYFEKKGLEKCKKLIETDVNCYLLVNIMLQENEFYQDNFLKLGGLDLLIQKVEYLFKKALEESKLFDSLEELLEVLVMLSQTEKIRNFMKLDKTCLGIYENLFVKNIQNFENEPECLNSLISFISNLCYSKEKSLIKSKIMSDLPILIEKANFLYRDTTRHSERVKENLGNFLINLCTEENIRISLSQNEDFLKLLVQNMEKINIQKNNKFIGILQSLLGVFSNLCYQATEKALSIMDEINLANKLKRFIDGGLNEEFDSYKEIYLRTLNILSRLSFKSNSFDYEFFQKNFMTARFFSEKSITFGYANHVLRLLAHVLSINRLQPSLKEKCKPEKMLVDKLIIIIKSEDEQRFCNACIVVGLLVETFCILAAFRDIIERLIDIVRVKVNLMRKNAAILLAKLSKDPENLEKIRELHGIELLQNISNIILNK